MSKERKKQYTVQINVGENLKIALQEFCKMHNISTSTLGRRLFKIYLKRAIQIAKEEKEFYNEKRKLENI